MIVISIGCVSLKQIQSCQFIHINSQSSSLLVGMEGENTQIHFNTIVIIFNENIPKNPLTAGGGVLNIITSLSSSHNQQSHWK